MAQSKNWCFTNNLDTESRPEDISVDLEACARLKYFIYQLELGENGNLHHQGYAEFKSNMRLGALKKLLPRAHWEPRRGSQQEAIDYCAKEDSRVEMPVTYGEPTKRNKGPKPFNERLQKMVFDDKLSLGQIAKIEPSLVVRHSKGLDRLLALRDAAEIKPPKYEIDKFEMSPINDWTYSYVVYGPTGCGKTSYALAHFKNALLVRHKDELKNFDKNDHDGIVFDDMSFRHWPSSSIIHLVDMEYPSQIDVKHATAYIPAQTKKIFTNNHWDIFGLETDDRKSEHPTEEQIAAIRRRVSFLEIKNKLY